jgi:hypothetical protein
LFQQRRHVAIRNRKGRRIDRSGERRGPDPPQEPRSKLRPVEPQRSLHARLENPRALLWGEPRPASHRSLNQINSPHFACPLKSEIEQKKLRIRKTQIC